MSKAHLDGRQAEDNVARPDTFGLGFDDDGRQEVKPSYRNMKAAEKPDFFMGGCGPTVPTGPKRKLRTSWMSNASSDDGDDATSSKPAVVVPEHKPKPRKKWTPVEKKPLPARNNSHDGSIPLPSKRNSSASTPAEEKKEESKEELVVGIVEVKEEEPVKEEQPVEEKEEPAPVKEEEPTAEKEEEAPPAPKPKRVSSPFFTKKEVEKEEDPAKEESPPAAPKPKRVSSPFFTKKEVERKEDPANKEEAAPPAPKSKPKWGGGAGPWSPASPAAGKSVESTSTVRMSLKHVDAPSRPTMDEMKKLEDSSSSLTMDVRKSLKHVEKISPKNSMEDSTSSLTMEIRKSLKHVEPNAKNCCLCDAKDKEIAALKAELEKVKAELEQVKAGQPQ